MLFVLEMSSVKLFPRLLNEVYTLKGQTKSNVTKCLCFKAESYKTTSNFFVVEDGYLNSLLQTCSTKR